MKTAPNRQSQNTPRQPDPGKANRAGSTPGQKTPPPGAGQNPGDPHSGLPDPGNETGESPGGAGQRPGESHPPQPVNRNPGGDTENPAEAETGEMDRHRSGIKWSREEDSNANYPGKD